MVSFGQFSSCFTDFCCKVTTFFKNMQAFGAKKNKNYTFSANLSTVNQQKATRLKWSSCF